VTSTPGAMNVFASMQGTPSDDAFFESPEDGGLDAPSGSGIGPGHLPLGDTEQAGDDNQYK
jgi:hypothetical protein